MTNALIFSYLFLGGTGAGAVFLLILFDLLSPFAASSTASSAPKMQTFSSPYIPQPSYRRLFQPGFLVSGGTLALGTFCLIFDLGRMDRLLLLFVKPSLSYVTIGTYALTLLPICTVALICVWSSIWRRASRLLVRIIEAIGLFAAFAVMLYTGLLFWSMGTGLILGSILLPILFVLSSLSCGIALLLALITFTETRRFFHKAMRRLVFADMALIVFELICLVTLLLLSIESPTSLATVTALLWGDYALIFWIGVVACGLLIPLFVESVGLFVRVQTAERYTVVVACLLLTGGYCLRWSLLGAGLPVFVAGLG